MKRVRQIHYRYLTDADFFNLNKPAGTEPGGGGQTYIDFPVRKTPVGKWEQFFDGVKGLSIISVAKGVCWKLPVHSMGISIEQTVRIYQRRAASVSISSQSLTSGNRIQAWLPARGFPEPSNPSVRTGQIPSGLCVYLVRTDDNEVWAGWFIRETQFLAADSEAENFIKEMVASTNRASSSGYIEMGEDEHLFLSEANLYRPFSVKTLEVALRETVVKPALAQPKQPTQEKSPIPRIRRDEAEIVESLFSEDTEADLPVPTRTRVQSVKVRNTRAVKDLKELYQNRCQISGERFAFKKINGEFYSEAHHLIALGEGGADDPKNMIVVNPLIHRMLHYAKITGLDFGQIKTSRTGESTLEITINGDAFKITWHKDHAKRVLQYASRT